MNPTLSRPSRSTPPKRRKRATRSLAIGLCVAVAATGSFACGRDADCRLADGTYRVSTPRGWDGARSLPVALYFHGWQQSAALVMRDEPLLEAFSGIGVLLVAPDGMNRSWTFPGSPSQARDDSAFALAVLDDVERRFPVDRRRIWATGFSQGGSMAWWLACTAGQRFAGFAPFAGAFWEPMPTDCPAGPASIMHTHGLADGTVPMAGRLVAGRFRQADVLSGMALWRKVDSCPSGAPKEAQVGELLCRSWSCGSGRELRLCLHPGGHELKPEWIAQAWAFVQERSVPR